MDQANRTFRKRPEKKTQPKPIRIIGYIVSIIVQIVFIYILRHLKEWGVDFLNEDYENALFYVELSIYISIAIHAIFIFFDRRWFKHLLQAISNIFGALAIIMVYVIFPFIAGNDSWERILKITLLVIFILSVIGTLAEIIKGFKDLAKEPHKI